jgi:hypothetical protein
VEVLGNSLRTQPGMAHRPVLVGHRHGVVGNAVEEERLTSRTLVSSSPSMAWAAYPWAGYWSCLESAGASRLMPASPRPWPLPAKRASRRSRSRELRRLAQFEWAAVQPAGLHLQLER